MITIAHLLDDPSLGGVTRFLDALEGGLGSAVTQTRVIADPLRTLPPALDADVVVVHGTMSWAKLPYLMALRARRGRRPIVLVEHSYTESFEATFVLETRRFHTLLRLAYGLVDRVVSVSYGQAAWLRRSRLLKANKLVVIAPFTACNGLLALPVSSERQGSLHLGAYGRYCAQKDYPTLIAAMRQVDPSVARLSLRGFGPDTDALRAAAAGLPHVDVGATIGDLAEFLSGVDAIAIPSCFEPFGQVALEARLAGRALIVTDVDGLPEQVEPTTGLIVPPRDPVALAAAIQALATARTAGALAAMGHAARETALRHIETSTDGWLSLLHELAPAAISASPKWWSHPTAPARANAA